MGFSLQNTALSVIGSLTGKYDPKKHQARLDAVDATKAAAIAGDEKSLVQLQCMAGITSALAISYGYANENNVCGLGDKDAIAYALAAYNEVKGRAATGAVLTRLGIASLTGAEAVQPGSVVGAVTDRFFSSKTFGIPTPLAALAAVGLAYWGVKFALKKGR